jgi:hypothetical protein
MYGRWRHKAFKTIPLLIPVEHRACQPLRVRPRRAIPSFGRRDSSISQCSMASRSPDSTHKPDDDDMTARYRNNLGGRSTQEIAAPLEQFSVPRSGSSLVLWPWFLVRPWPFVLRALGAGDRTKEPRTKDGRRTKDGPSTQGPSTKYYTEMKTGIGTSDRASEEDHGQTVSAPVGAIKIRMEMTTGQCRIPELLDVHRDGVSRPKDPMAR